jgi:hypothetical protein
VSISDSHFILSYFFRDRADPPCHESADVNTDGVLDLSDAIDLLLYLFRESEAPLYPYPEPGVDPNENDLGCVSTGVGQPLEDAVARLGLVDAIVPGGANAYAEVTIRVSSSTTSGGFSLVVASEAALFEEGEGRLEDLLGLHDTGFDSALGDESRLNLGYVLSFTKYNYLPAGEGIEVARLRFCLKEGTPAGEYPLTLEAGEIIDYESGQAIHPALSGGTLTVLEDVTGAECRPPPTEEEPPRNIEFAIGDGNAGPGEVVGLPFTIRADRPSQGFEFSVDFDEEVLTATDVVKRWQRPGETSYDFEVFEYDNENRVPGNSGVDEGFLVGAAIISLTDSESVLPPDEDVEVLRFVFTVSEEAPPGVTEIRFTDGAVGSGDPVSNKLIAGGERITPELADSFLFIDGRINILPDGALFIRGDSNDDGVVNISDPNYTLNHLFLGGPEPPCDDAADANDDGAVDISDAVATLQFLFTGGTVLPPPLTQPGTDPTDDELSCSRQGS